MKKNVKRILGMFLILMGLCHNFCYADVISLSGSENFFIFNGGAFIIGAAVIILTLISFYILQFTAKDNTNNIEEKKSNKDSIFNTTMTIAIILHCLSLLLTINLIKMILWIIPMILFIMSKAIRKSSKKISNIFWAISLFIIIAILMYNINWII